MKRLLIMAAALVLATLARADGLTSAIMTLNDSDRASDACDASSTTKLLHKSYRGTLVTKKSQSDENNVFRVDRDETIELLDQCARKLPRRSTTTRRLHKAEMVEKDRFVVMGEFTQEVPAASGKQTSVAYGTFITELACSDSKECKVLTDTVRLLEVFSDPVDKK